MFTSKLDECLVMNTPSHLLSSTSIDNPPCTQTTNSNNFTREEYFNPNLTVNESTNVIVLNNDSHHNECVIISQQNDANINGQDDEDNDNLFDDLSAAIEAINEANRLNSTCDDDHDIDEVCGNESVDNSNHISSTIQHHHHHHQQQQQQLQSVPGITTFRTITSTDHFVTHSMFVNISNTCINSTNQLTSFKCNSDELIQTNQNEIPVNHNTGISSCSSTSSIIMPSLLTTSSRPMNTFPLSWRLLLRPIFEKALIERLWTSGELGSSNPHALLLSMWFYISRHFGIGCRTDHAKLAYGNIIIGMNATTGERHLQFTSLPHGAASAGTLRKLSKRGKEFVSPVKPRHPDSLLPEYLSRPDRCPVRLFEAFCSHRPCSSTAIESPFYLQPDRSPSLMHPSTVNNVWFTSNALGKNKIGSMLNGALQSIGIPVGRQVSLARFCDALIAAAFSQPSSGDDENVDGTTDDGDSSNVGGALRNLLLVNCQSNKQIPESLQPIIAMYAENIVQMSRTPGSSVYVYLAKICEMQKALGKKRKADTRLSKISSKFLFTTSTTTTNDDDDDDDDEDVEDDDGNGDINHTNNVDDNHSIDFTRNLPVTTDNINHGTSGAMNVNYLKASPSLPTLTSGNLCIDSKQAGICYSDNHSMDDEDDDVGIDLFDLDHSDSSLNNPGDGMLEMQQHQIHHHHHQQQQQQIHKDQIRTGIGTTNDGDDDEMKQEMNCLTKVKLSPSQVDMNLGISQTYPFGDIMQTHGQTLFDVTSGQLFQLQQQQNPQQQLNDSSELLFTSSLSCANSVNSGTVGSVNISSPAVLFVPATYTTAAHNRIELNTAGAAPASSASSNLITGSSISAALPLDENMIDISRLGGIDSLMPTTMISSSISLKQSSPVNVSSQCLQSNLKHEITNQNGDIVYNQSNDDIRIDLRKTGGGSGRSVKLELRELLDLVLAASARTPNPLVLADSGKIYTPHPGTSQRPPVGLVTQLLWRARALDDRGPWILTFAMWWLMQHYFGIGSRMHHVRLRWGHLRLVSGVVDPLTGELCDAVEYVGPSAFTTAKACALLESNPSSQESPFRRVYPSSGWGEAEIAVAAALASELGMNRPRVRPLDTDPSVPPVPARSGPDFVSLYKSFARHRQQASLLPDAPFYVQPLQNSASALQSKAAIAWFSIGALGKNRIGALMRNIVDKVVRPDMPRVATAALSAATTACVIAADRAALALTDCHTSNTSDLSNRQQSLVDRLSCLLGTNMSNTMNMKTDILSNESPSNKNNHSMNINLSNDDSSGTINKTNTVLLSRLENPETNVLLLSSSSTGQLPSMMTTHSDIRNASHLVLKMPKLVTSPTVSSCSLSSMNNIPLSSMIAPLSSSSSSSKLSPSSFRNQIVYEASSFQQQQQQLPLQCQSLLFTQPSQQQTFIQENDRMIINPTNQLPTNSFVLLTTVDGQTFLAPSGANFNSIYPTGNQANSYILIPNPTSSISGSNSTSTTTTTTTTTTSSSSSNAISATTATAVTTNNSNNNSNNLTLRPEYMDALYSQSQHSVQQNPFILSGLGSQVLRTQNLVSSHQLATTSIATSRSSVTPRAFHQPIAYHLTSNPSSNNSIPVNLILLSTSNSSPSTFTPSPILLNATPTPTLTTPTTTTTALQAQSQSSNLATVYQTENRCDFDFSQCSTRDTNLIDSFQPIIIQRNDSNMTTLLVNTNNDGGTPVHRAITLMNSANPTSVNNSCNMTPVTLTLTTPKTTIPTTGTTITLPACNQIFYGRNSLQHQQQQQQHSQLPVLFDTSDMDQKLTASTTAATAAALFQVSPLKPTYQSQNSIVQALSCGQLVAIAQPGVGNSNIQPQLSTVIERKQESSTLPNQMQQQIQQRLQQQHQLINSSDLINDQSTITFLPFSNNHLTNNSITTTTTTANSSNINGNSSNNHKPDLYFELPIGDGDQHGTTGQTIYRLFCTDNSDRTIITNGTVSSDNEISRLFVVNNDHRLSDTMMNILTVDNSSYPSTLSSTTRTMTTGAAADHQFIIDQFPSIVNQHQHQLNGYASLSIPTASCITLSPPSSSSVLSTFSLASSSPSVAVTAAAATTITTTTTLAPSSPRLSSASSLFASNIHQTSKNSLITTSSLVNKVKRSNQLSEIHVDIGNRTTTNGNSISSDGGDTDGVNNSSHHLNAGYHIKIDESQYASPSLMTTTKLENYMDNNNNNDNDDCNNISNNDNDSNSNSKHHSNNSLSVLPPLSSMTCHLIPMEPKPDQLKTLQSVINSASAFQCSDFPAYVEQLFRKGILSGRRPWCLNFTAWFINTLVFEVENRTEHVSLRWGDFRLCQTADGQTEYIYFINRITNKHYYLAGSPSSCCALGYKKSEFDAKSSNEPPVRCPCPVAIFKELRDRRPSGCLDAYSKFYLQPRNVECPEANDIEEIHDKVQKPHLLPASSNWFTVHAWGKNKLGGLFAEASKLAGLPTIWLRKHRSRNFFPGGGGSGIGALGNLHHNQYLQKSINNLHRINSRTNDNDDIEHGEITSKENQELTGHTEVKRRRIMNCVTDTSSVLSLSLTMPMVAMSATPPTTLMNNNQSDSNVTGCVNILPSSMTILKPKETIYTSTIS